MAREGLGGGDGGEELGEEWGPRVAAYFPIGGGYAIKSRGGGQKEGPTLL